nr:E3 ubiquitin-protein ligase RHF1A-like [Ipomoea batatas]
MQCILEWSQRSKDCPICSRQVFLEDAASQELLAAVQNERNARSRCAAGLIQILSEDDILSEDIASIVTIPSPIIPASQATSFDPIVPELNGNLNQELLTAVENERNARSRCGV